MIYEVTMYAAKCDNCKKEVMEGTDYSCLGDKEAVLEEIGNADWIEHEEKHYCPICFGYDDNDQFIINPKYFKP